jgi:hypothetical protein
MTLGRGDLQMRTVNDLAASLVERAEPTGSLDLKESPHCDSHIDQIGHIGRLVAVSAT